MSGRKTWQLSILRTSIELGALVETIANATRSYFPRPGAIDSRSGSYRDLHFPAVFRRISQPRITVSNPDLDLSLVVGVVDTTVTNGTAVGGLYLRGRLPTRTTSTTLRASPGRPPSVAGRPARPASRRFDEAAQDECACGVGAFT
jgi:hypothetical protein